MGHSNFEPAGAWNAHGVVDQGYALPYRRPPDAKACATTKRRVGVLFLLRVSLPDFIDRSGQRHPSGKVVGVRTAIWMVLLYQANVSKSTVTHGP